MTKSMFFTLCLIFQPMAYSNDLLYGEATPIDSYDPYTGHEWASKRLSELIFNDLMTTDSTGRYQGELAKSFAIEADGKKVMVTLKDEVFWHSRDAKEKVPLSSDDILTTIRLLKNPRSEYPGSDRFLVIKEVQKITPKKFVVEYQRIPRDPLAPLIFKVLPHHILKDEKRIHRQMDFVRSPIGTGPFQFKKAIDQSEILLLANPHYFLGKPDLEKIVMKNYSDQNVMAKSLMYQSLDLMTTVSPRDLPELVSDKKIGVIPYDALTFTFFGINLRRAPFKDKRVREALSLLINREEMLKAFFNNRGHLISGPFPPTSWAYNIEVPIPKYAPEEAKELLKSASLTKTKEGWFLPNGKPFQVKLTIPITGESETLKRIALAVQSYFQSIDLSTELEFVDWSIWKQRILGDHDFDLTIANWSFDDAANITTLFHSAYQKSFGNNFVGLENKEVDALLDEANATHDFDKKRAIYHKLHSILAMETPYIYLWTLKHHAGFTDQLEQIEIGATRFFTNVHRWSFAKGEKNGQSLK